MDVVRHDYCHVQQVTFFVVVKTALKNDVAGPLGEDTTLVRDKRQEVRTAAFLDMRQVSAIEGHAEVLTVEVTDVCDLGQ